MTMQFVDGFLAAMLPSMFTVAWLVWRADPHRDYHRPQIAAVGRDRGGYHDPQHLQVTQRISRQARQANTNAASAIVIKAMVKVIPPDVKRDGINLPCELQPRIW